jgi:hypothetical protein
MLIGAPAPAAAHAQAPTVRAAETNAHEDRPTHVIVASHGRCGSNWLLEIFDQSPATHCRTDANSFAGSPFGRLPNSVIREEASEPSLEAGWDEALEWTHQRMGQRDGRTTARKSYYHRVSQALGLVSLVQRGRGRRLLSKCIPSLRDPEWLLPRWLGSREMLRRTLPVIKLGFPSGWMPWVMRCRPRVHVIHLTRHPGGYLNSWMTHYLSKRDREATLVANHLRLRRIERTEPVWRERFGDIAAMSVEESEMWYWIYAAETTHSGSATCKRYDVVHYEDLVRDTAATVRPIFERTGLEWNPTLESRIRATVKLPPSQASRWRAKIDAKLLAMVERLARSSSLCDWW